MLHGAYNIWLVNDTYYLAEREKERERVHPYFTKIIVHCYPRASSLLPKAKLVAILHDPVKRAGYSWYQHMRPHNNRSTAVNHTFSEVIRATPQSLNNKKLLSLCDYCLSPGRYHIHLSKWLKYYSYKQLYLVDGGELVVNPVSVLARLQEFLHVERRMNYSKILRLVLYAVHKIKTCHLT